MVITFFIILEVTRKLVSDKLLRVKQFYWALQAEMYMSYQDLSSQKRFQQKQFALSDADDASGQFCRGGITDLPLSKSQEPSFREVIDSFVLLV